LSTLSFLFCGSIIFSWGNLRLLNCLSRLLLSFDFLSYFNCGCSGCQTCLWHWILLNFSFNWSLDYKRFSLFNFLLSFFLLYFWLFLDNWLLILVRFCFFNCIF
jgi:hypothetical protein